MFNTVPTFNLDKLENVKSAVEHVGLYVGLVIFTAAGAKVKSGFFNSTPYYKTSSYNRELRVVALLRKSLRWMKWLLL